MSAQHPAWLDTLLTRAADPTQVWGNRFALPADGGRDSAVLILVGADPHDDLGSVVLTERASTLRSHPGQVSFPGGAQDPDDDGPVGAALREAHEEVGVDPASVEVLTVLPPLFLPVSDHVVTPVVGWWPQPGPVLARDPAEVARAVLAPVSHLVDPVNRFTVTHPSGYVGPGFDVDGLFVWGFTAGLLARVLELGGISRVWDESDRRPVPAPPGVKG